MCREAASPSLCRNSLVPSHEPRETVHPLLLGAFELANRIVIAPMCQYSAEKGCMTDWHVIHLGHLALSGAALLTIEATAVVPEGRITYSDVATTLHTAIAESKTSTCRCLAAVWLQPFNHGRICRGSRESNCVAKIELALIFRRVKLNKTR